MQSDQRVAKCISPQLDLCYEDARKKDASKTGFSTYDFSDGMGMHRPTPLPQSFVRETWDHDMENRWNENLLSTRRTCVSCKYSRCTAARASKGIISQTETSPTSHSHAFCGQYCFLNTCQHQSQTSLRTS